MSSRQLEHYALKWSNGARCERERCSVVGGAVMMP